jgi:small subunit ribosomal protein S3
MSHKVHPKAFRIRSIKDWDSRGFYEKNFALQLEEDFKIRKFFNERERKFRIGKVEIERFPGKVSVIVYTIRPGLIIGRSGEGIEQVRKELITKVLKGNFSDGKKSSKSSRKSSRPDKTELKIEIREIKNPWLSASLVAQWIAVQIEKRTPYRKVLKRTLSRIMVQGGAKGAKIEVKGRLNGIDIARKEWLKEGLLPRQTLRADIDYVEDIAYCTYGTIGIKVWIYKGETFE